MATATPSDPSASTYTYRGGRKVLLSKDPEQFVVRAQPDEVRAAGLGECERMSSASSRVRVPAAELESAMARARTLAPTHHAYRVAETGQEFLITDRVFVTFRQAPSAEQAATFAGRYGLRQLASYSPREFLFQVTDHTGINPVKLVVKLVETDPLVEAAENDVNYRAQRALILPTDPAYPRQWHLHDRLAHPDFDVRAHARCEQAWVQLDSLGDHQVVIGVTDDGCKLDHGDFDAPDKFAGWGYFQGTRLVVRGDVDAVASGMYQSGANHGTSCAGVAAGEADAVLTVGAAPGCRLLPVKWESQGPSLLISDSKFLTALAYVADKVDVLSNSWGIVPINEFATTVVNRVRALAASGGRRGSGILFLWAAGNDNCPIAHRANVDVPYTDGWELRNGSWVWVGVQRAREFRNNLAGVPGVLHVAALASTAQRSHYSNYGTGIAFSAPTNNVHSYYRMAVRGLGVTTATGETGGVTEQFGGTSSATPLAAGIAALVISANPGLSALAVASILRRTAAKDLDTTPYPRTPAASYDPAPTWDISPVAPFDRGEFQDIGHADGTWSPWFGHGRIDAAAAVAAARAALGPGTPAPGAETFTSQPGTNIPDNNPAGIRDTIRVARTGAVLSVSVEVDVAHTWIGDLSVVLVAPSGRSVTLHDRQGGSTRDLRRTFDAASTPGLQSLAGEAAGGDWTLWVRDLARVDTGRLQRWNLTLALSASQEIDVSEAPGITIPDNDAAGIRRSLAVTATGNLTGVDVTVDITHTYVGDLVITLRPPQGGPVELHHRAGGSSDNIRATWSSATFAGLQALAGTPARGAWTLEVADVAALDVGKLNRWGLRLKTDRALTPARPRTAGKASRAGSSPRGRSRKAPARR
jgi:subtilisin-like proprotein convertase family protein